MTYVFLKNGKQAVIGLFLSRWYNKEIKDIGLTSDDQDSHVSFSSP